MIFLFFLCPRMRLIIQVHQPLQTDPRIALCGRQTLVPQQLLHTAQIGTGIQQVGRERMAQGVGRDGSTPALWHSLSMRRMASRRSRRPPRAPTNRAFSCSGASVPRCSSQARNAVTDVSDNGDMRSRAPLPKTRATPSSSRKSVTSSPRASEMRRPDPYNSSARA